MRESLPNQTFKPNLRSGLNRLLERIESKLGRWQEGLLEEIRRRAISEEQLNELINQYMRDEISPTEYEKLR